MVVVTIMFKNIVAMLIALSFMVTSAEAIALPSQKQNTPKIGYITQNIEKTNSQSAREELAKAQIEQRQKESVELAKKQTVTPVKPVVLFPVKTTVPAATTDVQSIAKQMVVQRWGENEWPALYTLVMKESRWDPWAVNRSSGACGLFQALPCSKLGGMEIQNQLNWGLNYISTRYGTPSKALAFHRIHNWY